jgi:hypothetical protein
VSGVRGGENAPRRGAAGPACLLLAAALLLAGGGAGASDHGDTALLRSIPRHDARITDLFAFIRNENLVLAVCLDPTVPAGATGYTFPPDLVVRIHIDTHSRVSFENPDDLAVYGGTVLKPGSIGANIVFEVGFEKSPGPELRISGLSGRARNGVKFFAGLRDDPFIRGPVIGRNVAAIVVELPARDVVEPLGTILIWATSKIPEIHGPQADLVGRSLRSQFPENEPLNLLHPKDHSGILGLPPDVMIFDTSRHAAFPNGRELADDVVDLVGDLRVLSTDAPYPAGNDVPFLTEFPYLAPPQMP